MPSPPDMFSKRSHQHGRRHVGLLQSFAAIAACCLVSFSGQGHRQLAAFAQISKEARARQWNLMKQNFGTRWEGKTQWFSAGTKGPSPMAEAMRSIYQLEFPQATPELGTWRGWSVLKPGDTRVVPLSEATVVDRQPGSTTFQFEGVGGRNSLRTDGETWGAEINFFHAGRRSGLVVYYKDGELGSLMSMAFRSTPISTDGNVTFVNTGEFTAEPADPIADTYSSTQQRQK
eukprot:TRINITY_DN110684_c0_g1_i1.p1 TRINITY_DN110684_c0_g1~~TRINITY_DN110684_c0_g1_i1.p1  ORF type:complete len:252 (-),score=16.74 TRINITY_DN110684_c0_g1_i1:369-1061(-)